HRLGDFMVQVAEDSLNEIDAVLFMVYTSEGYVEGDKFIIDLYQKFKIPVFLILNKIDLIHPDDIFELIEKYKDLYDFAEVFPISALEGNNVEFLLSKLKSYLPEGPQYYPTDQITDHPERFIMTELIREKVLQLTREEIPHSIAVLLENIERRKNDTLYIQAVIVTERPTQKGILIGKQGKMLKDIGKKARQDI